MNKTEAAIFATDFCSVSFIVCIRLLDGAEGYLLLLWGQTHMYGSLPVSLGNLTSLKVLSVVGSLQEVAFSGPLPPARLQSLLGLWIMDTSFEGSLDKLVNLTQLKYLVLRRPGLWLSRIPPTLGPNLTSLVLSDVGLSGPLSDGFGLTWPYLVGLDLSYNTLSGPLPAALGNATGQVPGGLGECRDLVIFNASQNQLSGPLSAALGNAMNLAEIDLCCQTDGGFQGSLPAEWGSLTKLGILLFRRNNLIGAIPEQWGNLSSLQWLDLQINRLSRTLHAVGTLRNLKGLYLSNNQLTGQVPDRLGECRDLVMFHAPQNQLSGPLSAALGNATDIQAIDLCCQGGTNGGFQGSLPAEWGSLTKLEFLSLRENNLTGAVPEQWGNLSSLQWLDLGANRLSGTLNAFTGQVPDGLGECRNLVIFTAAKNQLSRPLPAALGNAMNLAQIDLCCQGGTNGGFQGSLPAEWGSLRKLEFLNLRQSNLTGTIPEQWGNLSSLQLLDLRANRLSGTLNAVSWLRNLKELDFSNNT
ncbi:unnamed protein product [Vitrella brassicaformis CCMP3155]|uniref:Leucine-rich repeat-containing N-terminal plant-type domain-containing protein n=1 Tax=Vitrella brassicaformis (strain CCMP3155) TaxID=1169540 RepID=A0A0G4GJ88_VITBC|nr:unnamed protein product [Vitrella brassicaformis CCMP3155]|eukprot:CEM29895.1 unnamed protein product [Vitrella brassicaformis CCMP3155]